MGDQPGSDGSVSAEEMAEAMYPESDMTYGYQAVREAFEYGHAAAQRVQPSREAIVEAITGPWFNSRTYSPEVVAINVEVLFSGQPTVQDVRAQMLRELADEEDREAAEEYARANTASVRCARCDLRYEEREQYSCHEHTPHDYREDELLEAGEVRVVPTYGGDQLRARADREEAQR
ncbi:hypothetical protein SDC9_181439 [bioreactor metagenome]|uniref:Uncharacterized protein n=1 Tax=bioreactor metagenome TaxID=1076179 RepID=A0A645H4L5_9ZZZZ